jgi:hypothetical protein
MAMDVDDGKQLEAPKLTRIKLTASLGLVLVIVTAISLLWVLGTFHDQKVTEDLGSRLVQITPDCIVSSGVHLELDAISFDEAVLEILLDLPQAENDRCRKITIQSSYNISIRDVFGLDKSIEVDEEMYQKSERISLNSTDRAPSDQMQNAFLVEIGQDRYPKSVFLRIQVNDPVSLRTFSEGEIRGIFIVDHLVSDDDVASFHLILHDDIRVTARDLGAIFADPRNPNIYRYKPRKWTIEGEPGVSRIVTVELGVASPDRDRTKETLLVILSALFGVGISALFESLLASEIYSILALGVFGPRRAEAGQSKDVDDCSPIGDIPESASSRGEEDAPSKRKE